MNGGTETKVKYASFLMIPLKYDEGFFNEKNIMSCFDKYEIQTLDLNENIKDRLNGRGETAVGKCYGVPREWLVNKLGLEGEGFRVKSEDGDYTFDINNSYFYVFHTDVAFLCLQLRFDDMGTLRAICNPGFADNDAKYYSLLNDGSRKEFSLPQRIEEICSGFKLNKFFDNSTSIFLDSCPFTVAVVENRFASKEKLRRVLFNTHRMMPIDSEAEETEEDVQYVYAVKSQEFDSYRWGYSISSQALSYVVANGDMDIDGEAEALVADALPIAMLAFYEKFTCFRFTEFISKIDKKHLNELKRLKRLMLKFRAYGTVSAANISRWYNVRQIYSAVMVVNDINSAISDIGDKLTILAEHQQEYEKAKNESIINIITVFGLVSILASVQSIIQILSDGDPLIWITTVLTTLLLALAMIFTLKFQK